MSNETARRSERNAFCFFPRKSKSLTKPFSSLSFQNAILSVRVWYRRSRRMKESAPHEIKFSLTARILIILGCFTAVRNFASIAMSTKVLTKSPGSLKAPAFIDFKAYLQSCFPFLPFRRQCLCKYRLFCMTPKSSSNSSSTGTSVSVSSSPSFCSAIFWTSNTLKNPPSPSSAPSSISSLRRLGRSMAWFSMSQSLVLLSIFC
mmetsp:Transcript_14376/g.26941  ORF Transcript_14376/g.26941 Transcript_14376/m.26941 type:complete len:204 (-) Transcript_14376:584-1195(-)